MTGQGQHSWRTRCGVFPKEGLIENSVTVIRSHHKGGDQSTESPTWEAPQFHQPFTSSRPGTQSRFRFQIQSGDHILNDNYLFLLPGSTHSGMPRKAQTISKQVPPSFSPRRHWFLPGRRGRSAEVGEAPRTAVRSKHWAWSQPDTFWSPDPFNDLQGGLGQVT